MKVKYLLIIILIALSSGCTLHLLKCSLKLSDYEKTYTFHFSKEELKNRIVEAYTYDKRLLSKIFGLTLIQNETINLDYRQSIEVWLDRQNWDEFESDIRNSTADTLNLLMGKHLSRKQIKSLAIISGDSNKSNLRIKNIEYHRRRNCNKDQEYYQIRISEKIDAKLIEELK
ncbi:hypothetical protein SAMN05661096_02393 [Marivirga sericea]|uniref:Uncharacterized protein n=1 Tax=Marivirga sericea TaxID=1028 RepID=A0A1X7K5P4_9BACT|nr:hypothetical protein [Marivirga sericea]SMG35958.1 hypothetical protein SAMN05661096_02393 [Marivirga sericea]